MHWQQFVMDLDSPDTDPIEAVFAQHGALSVTLTNAGGDPVLEPGPGATPLWRRTRVTALFDGPADTDGLLDDLRAALGSASLPPWRVTPLEDRDWEREWLVDFKPRRFGDRLWICPWSQEPPADAEVVVRLDPGLAFGTGNHATTALCLAEIDRELQGNAAIEKRVLDFGCGSGILAISSVMLGAAEAVAIDIDPQAVTATMDNAGRNGVADRVHAMPALPVQAGSFDLVVANILAGPLVDLAGQLLRALRSGGRLILSGILEQQAAGVAAAYTQALQFEAARTRDGWCCLSGRKA